MSIPPDEDLKMALPDLQMYKDINSDTVLPPVSKTTIRHYLNCTEKKFRKIIDFYESRKLVSARVALLTNQPSIFLKAQCRKTMTNLQYEINIKINSLGEPEESQCECPLGSETNAVCKHVGVALLAVENMLNHKFFLTEQAFTEKLQSFYVHKKRYTGTPIRGKRVTTKQNPLIFSPYPTDTINKIEYNQRFRNLIANYPNSTMPMKQLLKPANPYGIENDHQYASSKK